MVTDFRLPCLSNEAWCNDRGAILEKGFMYWMAAEPQDSNFFRDEVQSLMFVDSKSNDIETTISNIRNSLESLFGSYFDTLDVNVTQLESNGITYLTIDVKGVYNNVNYKLSKLILMNEENKIDRYNTLMGYAFDLIN